MSHKYFQNVEEERPLSVAGWKIAPFEDTHVLTPGTCKCYLIRQSLYKITFDKVKNFDTEGDIILDYLGLPEMQSHFIKERKREILNTQEEEKAVWPGRLRLGWYSHEPKNAGNC